MEEMEGWRDTVMFWRAGDWFSQLVPVHCGALDEELGTQSDALFSGSRAASVSPSRKCGS